MFDVYLLMDSVWSVSGVSIRLTDERWAHIVEGHPEMAVSRNEVLSAIADPDYVISGTLGELFAVSRIRSDKALVVIYKESADDGFILTAFFTSKIEKLLKRKILWRK